MRTILTHRATWDGPELPDGSVIYNAPRPIYGDVEWTGQFRCGVFYAAADAGDERVRGLNTQQDATLVELVDNDDVRGMIAERLTANGYGPDDTDGITTAELAAMWGLPWHDE